MQMRNFVYLLEMWSEAIKILKGEYAVRAIKEHKMDQAIVFCRTKIDCDNMEQYFMQQGGGINFTPVSLYSAHYQWSILYCLSCTLMPFQRAGEGDSGIAFMSLE